MSDEKNAYTRIVKSSSIIGGAQGINMLIGIVRVKFVALLIGPVGLGLLATYQSITNMIATIAGLGLQSSAVRDIAQAVERGDSQQIGRTVLTLRRLCWLTGLTGPFIVFLLSPWLSQITFNNSDQASNITLVSLVILFSNLKGGQIAIIQGMRKINDLAKLNIIGAISGTVISIMLYWLYGLDGIIPALVLLSICELIAALWFVKKIDIAVVKLTWKDTFIEAGGMVKMGLAFMWNGLLIAIVAYLTRVIISEELDMISVGIYTAAFALSGMIVNFILGAMGADYYPSLIAINDNKKKMCDLVNKQTEVGLLLSLPGLLITISFSPWIVNLFYSSEFTAAAELLRWFAIGCIGRVISWPMGFIILAKGRSKTFIATETVINIIHVVLIIYLLDNLGLEGVAIAYPLLYSIYTLMILCVSKYLIDFRWSVSVVRILCLFMTSTLIVIYVSLNYSVLVSSLVGGFVSGLMTVYSLRELSNKLPDTHKLTKFLRYVTLAKLEIK
ncbi:O-antigen translocase [Vibrio splendidus]|uniref:O-antigen translocase n=1 Tax=Vibrio splendidus TaxID=29497 RepID=UPI000C12B934|nr:O-antigen translocase [Vibrio splendidus]